jgi:hypothetical protein
MGLVVNAQLDWSLSSRRCYAHWHQSFLLLKTLTRSHHLRIPIPSKQLS